VWTAINDPDAEIISPTYFMDQGTGFHWAALEPRRFTEKVVSDLPISKLSNKYKAWKRLQGDKLILKLEDIVNIRKMVEVLFSKESVKKYLSEGWSEKSIIWFEEAFGIWCKCRIDWIRKDGQVLVDLKKCQVASRYAFEMSIRRYEYYMQAAHYLRGYSKVMGYRPKEWVWIASEINRPNECNVFVGDPMEIENAEATLDYWYEKYRQCLESGYWPGYEDEPIYLGGWRPEESAPADDEFSYF
jgi:exodeoxyribonuclease VIII